MKPTRKPDRVWIGRLDPASRETVYEALDRLRWPFREVPCEETAVSLTPEGALGILIRSWPSTIEPSTGDRLATLWAVPEGSESPPVTEDPPADFFRIGAPALDLEARLRLLTGRAAVTAELEQLRSRVEGDRVRRREIVQAISHDLGGPLAALFDFLAALGDSLPPVDAEIRSPLEGARRAAARLGERIAEIADLGRSDAGEPLAVNLRPIEIEPLLRDRAGPPPGFGAKCQEIRLLPLPALPPVCADPDRLDQILRHLIENAARHSPERAEIPIRAEADREVAGTLLLLVGDSGGRIGREALRDRFEPFGGLGIEDGRPPRVRAGLALVEAFTRALGGETVHRRRGREGSWFGVRLPFWGSRTGRIAEAQAALSATDGPEGGLSVWRLCGRAAIRGSQDPPAWRTLSPGEILVIGKSVPQGGTRLGRVRDLRGPRGIEAALAPRLRFERVESQPALEVA